jgi:hypothetical protein
LEWLAGAKVLNFALLADTAALILDILQMTEPLFPELRLHKKVQTIDSDYFENWKNNKYKN